MMYPIICVVQCGAVYEHPYVLCERGFYASCVNGPSRVLCECTSERRPCPGGGVLRRRLTCEGRQALLIVLDLLEHTALDEFLTTRANRNLAL